MLVKEWRKVNGVMTVISVIRHDNEFIVLPMPNNNPPVYQSNQSTDQYQDYTLCVNDTFHLKLQFTDADGDSLNASITGNFPGAVLETLTDTATKTTTVSFAWMPDSSCIQSQPHLLMINTTEQRCPFGVDQTRTYRLFVQANAPAVSFNVGGDILDSNGMDSIFLHPTVSNPGGRLLQWHTTGDGQFVNQYDPFTTYIPGSANQVTCSYQIWLELVDKNYCSSAVSTIADSIRISRVYPQLKMDTVEFPYYGDTVQLSTSSNILNGQHFAWSSTGDGFFLDSFSKAPIYVPGSNDWASCGWTIYLDFDATHCSRKRDSTWVLRRSALYGHQGPDSVYRGDTLFLSAFVDTAHLVPIHWSTMGDGVFGDTTAQNTWYYPGTKDYKNCVSQIILREWPLFACGQVDSIKVRKAHYPFMAGPDQGMHVQDSVKLDAQPSANKNWQFGYWTTSGTGKFLDSNDAQTLYFPSVLDIVQCTVSLFWNELDPDCGGRVDTLVLSRINHQVDAGQNQEEYFHSGMSFQLQGSNDTALGFYALWETSGDGSFDDSTSANAIYTLGHYDSANCIIHLKYKEFPVSSHCSSEDNLSLIIKDSAIQIAAVWVDSSNFDTIYLAYQGTSSRGLLNWNTNGSGTFTRIADGLVYYVLSSADKNLADIQLTLTYQAPCRLSSDLVHVDPGQIKLGIDPLYQKHIKIYPNPAETELWIDGANQGSQVVLYDIAGQVVLEYQLESNHTKLNIDNLPAGHYLLRITGVGGLIFNRMIDKK
ncbi:MAG: T9SS type A sorting domain-containing protein [Bacteroidetes bacterium]|nr:T9SS type A sorting domain-containing protein [Bacteroidota bacterium]